MLRLHSESSRSYTPQGGTELSLGDLSGELSCANMAALCVATCGVKQWRFCRTKVSNLLRLGTFLKSAIDVAISRKGPWRLSRTLATQSGMTNEWLEKQGLLSIKDLWVRIHYPATAR
jgi:hypothetical protein